MDQGYNNALENWVNRMSKEEREVLFEVVENWKKNHPDGVNTTDEFYNSYKR